MHRSILSLLVFLLLSFQISAQKLKLSEITNQTLSCLHEEMFKDTSSCECLMKNFPESILDQVEIYFEILLTDNPKRYNPTDIQSVKRRHMMPNALFYNGRKSDNGDFGIIHFQKGGWVRREIEVSYLLLDETLLISYNVIACTR